MNANVDLFNAGTVRGEDDDTNALKQVSLPAAIVQLSVTLPRFSEAGRYEVLVSRDKSGNEVVAKGSGDAVANKGKVIVVLHSISAPPNQGLTFWRQLGALTMACTTTPFKSHMELLEKMQNSPSPELNDGLTSKAKHESLRGRSLCFNQEVL